jgi:hypothetical protein
MSDHGDFLRDQARGELFLCLSDDDWIEPTFGSRVLALFHAHPEIAFAYTGCYMHFGSVVLPSKVGPEVESSLDFLDAYFAGLRNIYWCGCVVRTEDLRRLGKQPPDRHIGDMYYWTKLALEGPVGCVPKHLAHYAFLADNISIGIRADAWARETSLLRDEVLQGLHRLGIDPRRIARVAANAREYVGRSTANQIVLNSLYGMSKAEVARTIIGCSRYIVWDLTGIPRISAALILPPRLLRNVTLRFARRLQRRDSRSARRAGERELARSRLERT